jgi:hypothetical protein
MNHAPGRWVTINKLRGRGVFLVDPEGKKVGSFEDDVVGRQCAAAMNLTTAKQRTDYLADDYLGRLPKD